MSMSEGRGKGCVHCGEREFEVSPRNWGLFESDDDGNLIDGTSRMKIRVASCTNCGAMLLLRVPINDAGPEEFRMYA